MRQLLHKKDLVAKARESQTRRGVKTFQLMSMSVKFEWSTNFLNRISEASCWSRGKLEGQRQICTPLQLRGCLDSLSSANDELRLACTASGQLLPTSLMPSLPTCPQSSEDDQPREEFRFGCSEMRSRSLLYRSHAQSSLSSLHWSWPTRTVGVVLDEFQDRWKSMRGIMVASACLLAVKSAGI